MGKTSPFMFYANHVGRENKIFDTKEKVAEAGKTWALMTEEQRMP
jgi:hypothetical protein